MAKIMCPACFKGSLEPKANSEKELTCPECGQEFIKTGEFSVKFKNN